MKRHLRASSLAISILLFQPGGSAVVAHAQDAVTPLPEPAVGGVPGALPVSRRPMTRFQSSKS